MRRERFYRPLLRTTLYTYLPAQTSPDRFRHSDAVRYMYVAAGCRAADSTDSHVQARCRSQGIPNPQAEALAAMVPSSEDACARAQPGSRHAPQDI
jgi:hypothetical protein